MKWILFAILALFSEITGTVSGFGSSMTFVPIANLFFDFYSVLGITALFHLSSNTSKLYLFKENLDWKIIFKIGIPAVIFVAIGAYFSDFFKVSNIEVVFGIVMIVLCLFFLLKPKFKLQPTNFNSIFTGGLSGLFAGLFGTGGAVRGVALSAFRLDKNSFIATSAFIDLGVDFTRSIVYLFKGYVHLHDLFIVPVLLLVGFVGSYFGKKILDKINEQIFGKMVLIIILISSFFLVIKQFL